jgi:hypothetical protein
MTSTEDETTAMITIVGKVRAVKDREDTTASIGTIDLITLLEAFDDMRIEIQIRLVDDDETRIYA